MIDKYNGEMVFVFDADILNKHGFDNGCFFGKDMYECLEDIQQNGNLRFVLRCLAEEDETIKQIIPYVVMTDGDDVFRYSRGASGGEDRLKGLKSIGVGGHIDDIDIDAKMNLNSMVNHCAMRELDEEVSCHGDGLSYVGLINDDSNSVGKVHFGVVLQNELNGRNPLSKESAIRCTGLVNMEELYNDKIQYEELEIWSKLALGMLLRERFVQP